MTRTPTSVSIALLALALTGCRGHAARSEAASLVDTTPLRLVESTARPAPGPFPAPPPIDFEAGERPAPPTPIARDGAVAGRLTAEGQLAALTFDAEAGELGLFELTAYGYARGWDAESELVVRDAAGLELVRQRRAGGAQFGDLLAFVAPSAGAYVLEVVAAVHHFRYVVVRHARYTVQGEGAANLVASPEASPSHDWTAGPGSARRFVVRGTPGDVVALRAEPTVPRGLKHKRDLRARAAAVTAGLADARRLAERVAGRLDARQVEDRTFPDLTLTVAAAAPGATPLDGATLLVQGTFSALARFPASGELLVTVTQASEGPGLLFDLTAERGLALAPCVVRVGDADDAPVAGVEVALLREPALERFGRATTGADGTATFEAAPGAYTIVHRAPNRGAEVVRTELAPAAPVNLVLGP